ncbi:pectinesterase family protein [Roseateles asaccharophilus]|uniref:Pectinesterase n=1 Tax=Roseateles asaccharophilus TaxID=582607 RepID=A0ABU2AFB4_9BURK|nr:pectinesterase family protein [Roseateles asaccharophilus]MDR7335895.1 pectinesterase [Roseateles asaccharophilus]
MRFVALVLAGAVLTAQAQRPQLSAEQAAAHTTAAYLGDWTPAPLADLSPAAPDFIVRPGESVQAAIDKVPAEGSRRWIIQIQPGTYRGPLCIKDKAPLALVGAPLDAAAVVLVDNRFSGKAKGENEPAHPCWPELGKTTIGTSGSTSMLVQSNDVQLLHLTVANDAMDAGRHGGAFPAEVGENGGAQAVALTLTGDRIQLENVRLLGHQDTLYVKRAKPDAPARQLIRHSLIAGDVDFIFGAATLVIEQSTILTRANRRKPGQGGIVLAPSTPPGLKQGFLVTHSRIVGEPGINPGATALGRAWDAGVKAGTWTAGVSPDGMAVVRDSDLGAHVGPWSASTSRRPPDASRLTEFNNRQP